MPEFDDQDAEIAIERTTRREAKAGPRVGDFLKMPNGDMRRFAHHWGDSIQPNDPRFGGEGRFYLHSNGAAEYSGSLASAIPVNLIGETSESHEGRFWIFHHDQAKAHNGVTVTLPCRVFTIIDAPPTGLQDAALNERLFTGIYSTGIVYADRGQPEQGGDYKRLAFLGFDTLQLDMKLDCPPDLRAIIETHAAAIQAKRGEEYQITTSGQTVTLGHGIKTTIVSNGSKMYGEPVEPIEELFRRLDTHPLEATFAPFVFPSLHETVNFRGNFNTESAVFNISTNDGDVIERLKTAIAINMRRPDYLRQIGPPLVSVAATPAADPAPATDLTDQGEQIVIPGAEKSAVQAAVAREATGRGKMRSRRLQKPAGGMFDATAKDCQPSLFDHL